MRAVVCALVLSLLPTAVQAGQAVPPIVKTCGACHSATPDAGQPRGPKLEGLTRSYLTRQIQAWVGGVRTAPPGQMGCPSDVLSVLRPIDFVAVVGHYSQTSPTPDPVDSAPADLIQAGQTLYREGDLRLGVQPCRSCHGNDATGGQQTGLESAVIAPRVAGQDRDYLLAQLRAFKRGERANDYQGIMQRMVQDLSDYDFEAVAAYLATLDPATVPPPPAPPEGGIMPEKAALCQACHGLGGESVAGTFPKIGGLSVGHIGKQLRDIKEGRRTVDVMTPIAYALTDAETQDIATWFSRFEMRRGPYDSFKARRGEELFLKGNLVTGYPACMYCHGVDGRGIAGVDWAPGDVPRLAGQHPSYIVKALYDFKEGRRSNDHQGMMRNIARQMTPQEIEDVSHYLYSMGAD